MTLSYYIQTAKQIDLNKFEKKLKVAFLSSFTINGLPETITVKCSELEIGCKYYQTNYNQYSQEILNESSSLYKFKPDVSFLIINARKILGNLFFNPYSKSINERKSFIKKTVDEYISLVRFFTKKSQSKLIITSLQIPNYSPYGIFESKTEYGLYEMVEDFNVQLRNYLKNEDMVFIFDFNSFIAKYGDDYIFDFRQYFFGDINISLQMIENIADEFMGYIKPLMGINRKCIVLDLDNTLWGGIIGEDGFENIELGPNGKGGAFMEFQYRLLALQQRGIILAINSKNNSEDALKVIREHPHMILKENHFACVKINWNDKASNMKEIANDLNIGLDSMVFFDDDKINQELIKKKMPEVLTVELPDDPSSYTKSLLKMNDFNILKITSDDTNRGKMYQQQKNRKKLKKSTINLDEFLDQLETKIKIKNADKFTIPRISQLTLKTNQFNLTTNRYQEEQILNFSKDENMIVNSVQVEDKFGDNGTTGVFIINKKNSTEWILDTFLLSCRVMGRKVEEAIMSYIISSAKNDGVTKINASYIPTQKNKPCEFFLSNIGFKEEQGKWIYKVNQTIKIPQCVEIISE